MIPLRFIADLIVLASYLNVMLQCIKLTGTTSTKSESRSVQCFVRYSDPNRYDSLVNDDFRYRLRLDLEIMRRDHPDHFTEPHNIARAIAIRQYFGPRLVRFSDSSWESILSQQLPTRLPDASDDDYAIWIEPA